MVTSEEMISRAERVRRDRAIALLRAFAAGKLTNDEFEDRYDENLDPRPTRNWDDPALWAIKTVVWHCYDDLSTHRLEGRYALTKEGKENFARCILFLKTNQRYEWERYDFISFHDRLLDWLTFGWWNRRQAAKLENIDWDIWPFKRPEHFESAKLHPR